MESMKRISPDTRFQPVVDFYFAECERRDGLKPMWDASDGQALGRILFSQKQAPVEKLLKLVETAFNWAAGWAVRAPGVPFCPLQPGFRFREFCAHFGRVVCYRTNPLSVSPLSAPQGGEARQRVTAREISKVFREYGDRVQGKSNKRELWDQILGRRLGITYSEAEHILETER